MTPGIGAVRYRWWILGVFVLSSAINYLDRQSLATLAPLLRAEFQLSREQYGWILGAFSITYAASAPFSVARFQNSPSKNITTIPGVKKPVYS